MRKHRCLFASLSLILLSSCGSETDVLRLAMPVSTLDREIVQDVANLMQGRIRIELSDTPLSEEAALEAVASGMADLAVVSNNQPFRDDIATIVPLYPAVLHIAQSRYMKPPLNADVLRSTKIYAGAEGSGSRLVFSAITERLGISHSELNFVEDPSEIPNIVVVFAALSPERMQEFPDYRLVSIGTPADIGTGSTIDTAVLLNPHFRPFVIPIGTYGESTPQAIVTIAVDRILITRPGLDRTVVYDLINEIMRLRPAISAQRPGVFHALSGDFDANSSRFVLHGGAQDYLQRAAPSIYERYSGVAEVIVTLIVGLSSATFAGMQIYRSRRKNRIDTFYSKTIELHRSVTETSSQAERQRTIEQIRDLQTKAFDLLVDEKLAADESFRIFITLSNDALRQLGADNGKVNASDN